MKTYFKIQQIPGKGNGLIATQDLFRGTKIISESPLLNTFKGDQESLTDEKIETLARDQGVSDRDWQTFRGFYTRFDQGEVGDLCGRFISGSFNFKHMHAAELGMVFLNISRITHSCSPNSIYSFNEEKNEGRLYVVKHIQKGEEITICYSAGSSVPLEQRRAQLMLERRFNCLCELCSKNGAELEGSRKRLQQIDHLVSATKQSLESNGIGRRPVECLRKIFLRIKYLNEEGIRDTRESQCYRDAYDVVAYQGNIVRAREFIKLYTQAQIDCFGKDSVEFGEVIKLANVAIAKRGKNFSKKRRDNSDLSGIKISQYEAWLWMLDRDDK
jgi:SET domain